MKEIKLTQGHIALVDDDDYEEAAKFKWYPARTPAGAIYAYKNKNTSNSYTALHRLVLKAQPGQVVDHINGNPLDNRRANLRLCSMRENARNARKYTVPTTTAFKGVMFRKDSGKYRARIRVDDTLINLGQFDSPDIAARAYDQAALHYFGEFARLNFPPQTKD